MLKAVGSVLLLCGCIWIGMMNVKQMDKRLKILRSLLNALEVMEREMSFSMPLLEDLLICVSRLSEGEVRRFLSFCSNELKNESGNLFCEIWNRAAYEHLAILKREDLDHVLALGNVLGRYDSDGQRQAICHAHAAIKQILLRAETERTSQGKVYKAISATVGVFLVILLL